MGLFLRLVDFDVAPIINPNRINPNVNGPPVNINIIHMTDRSNMMFFISHFLSYFFINNFYIKSMKNKFKKRVKVYKKFLPPFLFYK